MAIHQAFAAPISDTAAHYKAWAQFLGGGFTTCGWQAQTGHGEVVASGTGASYAWTNVITVPTVSFNVARRYTFKGAWSSGATYLGGTTADIATEVDVVTDGGLTYVHITASSNSATAPGSDATNWQPYNFEVWKSTGSMSTNHPIYVKFVYTTQGAANNTYRIHISIGTGVDSDGNLTGVLQLSAAAPLSTVVIDNTTTTNSTVGEMDFSGDADNFRFSLWRGGPASNFSSTMVVDRAKTSSGTDSDAFVYVGTLLSIGGAQASRSGIIFKPSLGGAITFGANGWVGCIGLGTAALGTLAMFGAVPILPVFPLVGYLANPLLGVIGVNKPDSNDGTVTAAWLLGASHTYLVISTAANTAGANINNIGNGIVPAIRWE